MDSPIKALRQSRNMTQAQRAAKAGWDNVQSWQQKEQMYPHITCTSKYVMAEVFDMTRTELLAWCVDWENNK